MRRWVIVLLTLLGLLLVRTARAENPRPPVHLLKGEPAPYEGDLAQPITLMTLAAEHKQLKTTKRKLSAEKKAREIDRVAAQETNDALRANLDACENQKAPPIEVPAFYEHPVFIGVTSAILGGLVTYGVVKLVEDR